MRTTQQTTARHAKWVAANYGVVRLAGRSFEELNAFRLPETARAMDELAEMTAQCDRLRDALSQTLYEVVGAEDESDARKLLVACRRDIYNIRPLSEETLVFLSDYIDRTEVEKFYRFEADCEEKAAAVESCFQDELATSRRHLQNQLSDTDLLHSILLTRPEAFIHHTRTYTQADPARLRSKERQIEQDLYLYVMRMSAKTSPFARFCQVVPWQADGATRWQGEAHVLHSVVHLNQELLAAIASHLANIPAIQSHLRPSINETLATTRDKIEVWVPRFSLQSGMVRSRREHVQIKNKPLVQWLLAHLQTIQASQGTLTDYLDHIRNRPRVDEAQWEQVRAFIMELINRGIITLQFELTSHQYQRLSEIQNQLQAMDDNPDASRLLDVLSPLETVPTLYRGDISQLYTLHNRMKSVIQQIMPVDAGTHVTGYLFEDTTLNTRTLKLGQTAVEHITSDIERVLNALEARDGRGPGYALLCDTFVQQYGEGGETDNILQFAHRYENVSKSPTSMYNPTNTRFQAWFASLQKWEKRLSQQAAHSEHPGACDVTDMLDEFVDEASLPVYRAHSLMVMGQIAADSVTAIDDGDFELVVNGVLPGFGRLCSRYHELLATRDDPQSFDIVQQIRQTLAEYEANLASGEVVEFLSVGHNNAQIHPAFTSRQIVLPDENSNMPPEQQIHFTDLSLRHDPETDELQLFEGDKQLHPVYTGFFHPLALKGVQRVLADMSPTGHHFDVLIPNSTRLDATRTADDIVFLPRLKTGQVILQRAAWRVQPDVLESLLNQSDEQASFSALRDWAKTHQLPSRLFVRVENDVARMGQNHDADDGGQFETMRLRKPIFIDFDSYFSVVSLQKLLKQFHKYGADRASFYFEEMLPDPDDLFTMMVGDPYVSELQLQFERRQS